MRQKLIGMVAVLGLCGALTICASAPASADTVIGTCTIVSNPTPTTFTNCPGANLTGPVNLTGFDLAYANLSGADLTGATLTGVVSGGLTGSPTALPAGWSLVAGYLVGPGANLTNANLANADLSAATLTNATLTNATLTGANLSGANLTGATLTGVTSGGITGTPAALPTGWTLVNGYLVGPGANLTGANLTNADLNGANLTNATLTGANLAGANLTGATLTGVKSGGITGSPTALPASWSIVAGYLIGPGANLALANLTGANLSGATLTGANLRYAVLTGANLAGTDLSGTDLTGVKSGGITGTPSALPAGWNLVGGYLLGPDTQWYVSMVSPLPLSTFRRGSIIPVTFRLTSSTGQPLPDALAAGLGCDVTVTFNLGGPLCPTYNPKKALFAASIVTSKSLTPGVEYSITVLVVVGTTQTAIWTVAVIAK